MSSTKPKAAPPRKDIQALRAIAIILVLLNHLWPTRLTGGYIGVDVFFVISGFLITAHLLREIQSTGRIALPRFYARRARRLLPAAILVGLVSFVATFMLLPAERWERIGREIFAAAAYFENWLLAASAVDYSAQNEAATPAQHYWSLSVEEQFYLLWPITLIALVWLITRRARSLHQGALAGLITLVAAASFGFALWYTTIERSAAYFNTFTRVWEFMLGALVAVAAPALTAWYARTSHFSWMLSLRGVAQLAGYAAIAAAALLFDTATAFPGPWALLPVAATALIIAAGPETPRWSPARWLHWRPVQYTGDISYSLYLWHWPLIVFAPFVLSRELRMRDQLLILALTFVLAALTKHLIEDPGRTRLFAGLKPRVSLLTALGSVVVIGALVFGLGTTARSVQAEQVAKLEALATSKCWGAGALASGADCGDPFGPAVAAPQGEHNAPWKAVPDGCVVAPAERQILAAGKSSLVECDFSTTVSESDSAADGAPSNVWLVGDSHAEHFKATVYSVAQVNGWRISATMQGGCPILPITAIAFRGGATPEQKQADCLSWSEEVSERLLADNPDLVIVSNFAAAETVDDGTGRAQAEQLAAAFPDRIGRWTEAGANVVVIRDTPTSDAVLGPNCVLLTGHNAGGCTAPKSQVLPSDPMFDAAGLVDDDRVLRMDLTDRFCVDDLCSGVIGGLPVYYDADHVSLSYAETLAPTFGERLSKLLGVSLRLPDPASN